MSPTTAERLSSDRIGRVAGRMRARRFALFAKMVVRLPKPLSILDLGGRAAFWAAHGWADRPGIHIVTGNIEPQTKEFDNIEPRYLDATNLSPLGDESFDIVFSNSVIEHLFTWENQQSMAREVRRVGKAYWVQTPNYWFPLEPHFRFIGWQWLPVRSRIAIIRRRGCGWRARTPDLEAARQIVNEVRLMRRKELAALFPGSTILPERFLGLTKSWIALAGFPDTPNSAAQNDRAGSCQNRP